MKRPVFIVFMMTIVSLFLLTACAGQTSDPPASDTASATTLTDDTAATTLADATSTTATTAELTAEDAKTAALTHAGLSEATVTGLRAEPDFDAGRKHYDVEFFVDRTEYDYEIDAQTGAVLSYDVDGKPGTTAAAADTMITAEQAQTIALEHAQLTADQVTRLRAEPDFDDGKKHYDVEFFVDRTEYDYEIDAQTGAVLSYDVDAN